MSIAIDEIRLTKPLPHPGLILQRQFMAPAGVTAYALAEAMGIPRQRIERLSRGEQALTADTALRLARVFPNTSAQFWMNLQSQHDLSKVEIESALELDAIGELEIEDEAANTRTRKIHKDQSRRAAVRSSRPTPRRLATRKRSKA